MATESTDPTPETEGQDPDTLDGLLDEGPSTRDDAGQHSRLGESDEEPVSLGGSIGESDLESLVPNNIGCEPDERYHAVEDGLIGRGGMGRVEEVEDRVLRRAVARKVLEPLHGDASAATVHRFLREARVTAQLEHPGIVPIHDLIQLSGGRLAYTMKRVRGRTLAQAIADCTDLEGRLALLGHIEDACNAVAFAHSQHVVHRDLKPANILIGEFGETVIIDWGLAGGAGERGPEQTEHGRVDELDGPEGLTRAGLVLGTPRYMSPEQARAQHHLVDARSDVWALGLMLRELLTGTPPHGQGDVRTLLGRARRGRLTPCAQLAPGAPRPLCSVADKANALNQDERYRDAGAMAADVAAWRNGRRVSAHRYGLSDVVGRVVMRNRRAVMVAVAAVIGVVVLSVSYAVRLSAARDAAHMGQLVAERAQRQSQVGQLRAEARRAVALGHHDRNLSLLWAAHTASSRTSDDLRAELLRAVGSSWPQEVVIQGDAPLKLMLSEQRGQHVFVVRDDGTVASADGASTRSVEGRVEPEIDVLAVAEGELVSAHSTALGVEVVRHTADGGVEQRWAVPGSHDPGLLVAVGDGGWVVGAGEGELFFLAPDGGVKVVGRDTRLAQVESVAVSRERGLVVSATMLDNALRFWSWPDAAPEGRVELGASALDVTISDVAAMLIVLTDVGVLEGRSLEGVHRWEVPVGGHQGRLVLAPNGETVVVMTRRGELLAVDVRTGRERWRLSGVSIDDGLLPVFDAAGLRLAVVGKGNNVLMLDAETGVPRVRLGGGPRRLSGIAFTQDGRLWAAGEDGTLRRWSAPVGDQSRTWTTAGTDVIAHSGADGQVLMGAASGVVWRLDGEGSTELASLGSPVCALGKVGADWMAVVSDRCGGLSARRADSHWQVYSLPTGEPSRLVAEGAVAGSVVASVDAAGALVLAGTCIERVDASGQRRTDCLEVGADWRPESIARVPDGGVVVSGFGETREILGLDAAGRERFRNASAQMASAARDGSRWVISMDEAVAVLDGVTGQVLELEAAQSTITAVGLSADAQTYAWATASSSLEVLSASDNTRRTLHTLGGPVRHLMVENGGDWIVGVDEAGHVLGWTPVSAEPVLDLVVPRVSQGAPLGFYGGTLWVFGQRSASSVYLDAALSRRDLNDAARVRTPWRVCPSSGHLGLLPDSASVFSKEACSDEG